ncbi:hypothetical protein Neosp_005495 [[Neocosmospora] mangrovei]
MLPENFKYYGHWGYTIYRTYYGPESDEHWDTLLDALKRQTSLALAYHEDDEVYNSNMRQRRWGHCSHKNKDEYMDDLERLKKLFHLDPRENSSLLDGLDVRQLRKVCLDEHTEAEKTMAGRMFHFALVADEAVLKDIARGEFVVKAVAYDWEDKGEYWAVALPKYALDSFTTVHRGLSLESKEDE